MSGSFRRRAAIAGLVLLVVVGACSDGEGDLAAGPTTSSSPEPSTPDAAAPVSGQVDVQYKTVTNVAVFNDGDPNAVDPPDDVPAIEALITGTTAWLDGHLTDLQNGGGGTLDQIAAPGLMDGSDPALLDAVAGALASPETPVAAARYQYLVATVAGPVWLRAQVTVDHPDGPPSTAQFVLVPGDGGPKLVAAGPGSAPAGGEG